MLSSWRTVWSAQSLRSGVVRKWHDRSRGPMPDATSRVLRVQPSRTSILPLPAAPPAATRSRSPSDGNSADSGVQYVEPIELPGRHSLHHRRHGRILVPLLQRPQGPPTVGASVFLHRPQYLAWRRRQPECEREYVLHLVPLLPALIRREGQGFQRAPIPDWRPQFFPCATSHKA